MLGGKGSHRFGIILTLLISFLITTGAPQANAADSLSVTEFLPPFKVEFLPITTGEPLESPIVVFFEMSPVEFLEVSEFAFSGWWVDPSDGLRKLGRKPPSVEEIMCGPSIGLAAPEVCLFVGQ